MASEVEQILIEQLRELRREFRALSQDLRNALVEIGVLKTKMIFLGAVAASAASLVVHWANTVFF